MTDLTGKWKTRSGKVIEVKQFMVYRAVVDSKTLFFNDNGDCSETDFDLMHRLPEGDAYLISKEMK